MGYACPVCDAPQADGEHLANHLAFTALLGDDDHERWLDERVPDWGERDPAGLADAVVDRAAETDYPQVFEDTTGEHAGRPEDELAARGGYGRGQARRTGGPGSGRLDETAERVLDEARELTAEMYDLDETAETAETDDSGDAEAAGDGDADGEAGAERE